MPSFAQADIILALISMVFREGHIVKCNAEEDGHVSDIRKCSITIYAKTKWKSS